MKNILKNNRGFSLVEILGVMVILSILLVIGINSYSKYRKSAAEEAYKMISQNAASAAEEYFMDHITMDSVDIETLVNEQYLENPADPFFKEETCTGSVARFSTKKAKANAIDLDTYKVIIECKKHTSCDMYPKSKLGCDAEGGIVTDGEAAFYSFGLANHSFGSNLSYVIRVKFNSFKDGYSEYFGNWENAGGGLGLTGGNHDFYFNLYNNPSGPYVAATSSVEARTNKWYVVVGVLDSGTLKLYIDGQLQATNTLPSGVAKPSTMEIYVGGNPQPNENLLVPVPITASYALVYDRALTSSEITGYFSDSKVIPENFPATPIAKKVF